MSMKLLTLLQFVQIFSLYALVTVALPAWAFHRKLSGFSLSERLLLYFVMGNFFVINLVLILQLAHISNRLTLTLFTVGITAAIGIKNNDLHPLRFIKKRGKNLELILSKKMGVRTHLWKLRKAAGRKLVHGFRSIGHFSRGRIVELVLLAGVTGLFFWRFGQNLLSTYGYGASDMIVHNYWVNSLGEGKLFVAGVYPFGFHCTVYYFHEVFDIDNYVILRIFWMVQILMLFYGLVAFLKECCKNRYLPYLGMLLYILGTLGVLGGSTYTRFFSSLPQEFGMIYVLPSIQFLFAFFRIKKMEIDAKRDEQKRSLWCLIGFAVSLSLTLAVHFYNTMIVGLLCIGGVFGYGFRLFQKKYFGRVMLTGIIGILAAVLPLATALAMGKPMEGSLRWGISVLKGSSDDTETQVEEIESSILLNTEDKVGQEIVDPTQKLENSDMQMNTEAAENTLKSPNEPISQRIRNVIDKVKESIKNVIKMIERRLNYYLIAEVYQPYGKNLMWILYTMPFIGLAFLLTGHRDYGARLLSVGCGTWVLSILMIADEIGLPTLMDASRCSIYTVMMIIVGLVLVIDAVVHLLAYMIRTQGVWQAVGLPVFIVIIYISSHIGLFKEISPTGVFGTNEAVTCLTNIIKQYPDKTWTICSANDELRMADDHGYHYELTEFLGGMEHLTATTTVQMPTRYVFFFIEKIPINYDLIGYEGSGQKISEEGASKRLVLGGGLAPYQNENRWIIMSRMYYWAQEFQRMYPNEFKVYFENENFVCYYVEQNPYALYNFAIDYGYNQSR